MCSDILKSKSFTCAKLKHGETSQIGLIVCGSFAVLFSSKARFIFAVYASFWFQWLHDTCNKGHAKDAWKIFVSSSESYPVAITW